MENIFENIVLPKFEDIDNKTFLEQKELFRAEAQIRNSTIVECPHCHIKGNEPNMLRWHFDNEIWLYF